MANAQVNGARLIKERVLAGEVELAWDVRRSHPVPTTLSDYDKFCRYTAFRPYLVYRHPEQSLQDSIVRLRPRRFRRLQKHEGPPPVDGGPCVRMITGSLHFLMRAGIIFLRLGQIALWVLHEVGLGLLTAKAVGLALKGRVN
jgi:hypothetical protein